MKFLKKAHEFILDFKYDVLFEYVATVFALLYHIGFLITFWKLGVTQMACYNIFSVCLFSIILFLVFKRKPFFVPFIFFYVEVVTHQILADYFLGAQALFHFLILMIGLLPFFCFKKNFFISYFFGLLSTVIFIVLEVLGPAIPGVIQVPAKVLLIIKAVNVGSSTLVIITCFYLFSYLVTQMRFNLEEEVQRKTERILIIQNHIINSLASLVDNRDTDTGKHIQRTCAYVEIISQEAAKRGLYSDTIDTKFIGTVKQAAPLHDIGKIVIPDEILKKPGRFTPDEFDIMKKHASEGGRIVNEVVGVSEDKYFLNVAGEIATAHHEKWDGSGYPKGLQGNQIPVSARIMAVADVFDALVSKRCYKDPMSCDIAFEIIKDGAGKHFDPEIVDIFLDQKKKIIEAFETYKDND